MGCGGCGHKYMRPPRNAQVGSVTKTLGQPRPIRTWKYTPRIAPQAPKPVEKPVEVQASATDTKVKES